MTDSFSISRRKAKLVNMEPVVGLYTLYSSWSIVETVSADSGSDIDFRSVSFSLSAFANLQLQGKSYSKPAIAHSIKVLRSRAESGCSCELETRMADYCYLQNTVTWK
jgi:hypothetical protein